MALKWPNKDPNEVLDYQLKWGKRVQGKLTPDDTITASEWIVPTGIVMDADTFTDITTTIWLSGGTDGVSYTLINRIDTTEGRTMDQSVVIRIKER